MPVTVSGRCAVALATVPVVAQHRPDAVVVWFDAHADVNTPATTATGYLGGLALADLHAAAAALAHSPVLGIEVAELETLTQDEDLAPLLNALEPVLAAVQGS